MSIRPTPWAPARRLSSLMACSGVTLTPSIATGTPASKEMVTSSGAGGNSGVGGVVVDVLGGGVPDVLEEAGLDGAAPDVLVDRVRVLLGGLDRQSLFLGEGDGLVAGQGEVADRGDALQVRAEGLDADLEADLVVALAGAAVGDGGGAEFAGGLDQVLDDHRAGDRRDQRVVALVEGVGLQRGHAVLVGELVAGVGDVGLDGAAAQRALADGLQRFAALSDVDRHGDDLGAGGFTDPADGYGSIQATGVGQNNTLSHGNAP